MYISSTSMKYCQRQDVVCTSVKAFAKSGLQAKCGRPVRMSSVNPVRGGSPVLTLNPARVLLPDTIKDERLFSCRAPSGV